MIITTTPSIEGQPIREYIGMIEANLVIGANFLRDFMATFTDVFGGNSEIYQSKLNQSYAKVMKLLEQKAFNVGADAIVGVRVDFDEISGGGKSMFMITAVGTAVKLNGIITSKPSSTIHVSAEECANIIKEQEILKRCETNGYAVLQESSSVNFLANHASEKGIRLLVDYAVKEGLSAVLLVMPQLIRSTKRNFIADLLYSYGDNGSAIKFIYEYDLLDLNKVENVLSSDVNLACKYLQADKAQYSKEDLNTLEQILQTIDNLPSIRHTEDKKGLLGSSKEVLCCSCGTVVKEGEYCSKCDKNNVGLTRQSEQILEKVRTKVDVLKSIFN